MAFALASAGRMQGDLWRNTRADFETDMSFLDEASIE